MDKLKKFISSNLIAILGYIVTALFIYYNIKAYNPHFFFLCFMGFAWGAITKFKICFQTIFIFFIIELIIKRFFINKDNNTLGKINLNNKIYDFLFRLGIFLIIAQFLMIINPIFILISDALFHSIFISNIVLVLPFVIVGFFVFRKQG